ncbi:DUF6585 family protein [Actinomadura algeriensis]|uniref:PH (Pleckstrin Homology) domain-containing protein n=1 Tax=Actinomadura algeriensis TaxID=1679523 RepID=A0ABR9JSD7_9ACTN|nr:DUF6585 family protein [Actinomadura algeriensis]MBE1533483.1 hypothetical protein [Actinomadura algeriensis]
MVVSRGRLGAPVRTFDARPARRAALGWMVAFVLATAVLTPVAVWALDTRRWGLGTAAALLGMVYAAAAGWIAGRDGLWSGIRVAALHTEGVAARTRGGAVEYAWDELESVTVSGVQYGARVRWRFAVAAADGRVLRFGDQLPDVRELGEAIAAEVADRTVARHLESVRTGAVVRLGPFAVDLDGVEKDGERLPWKSVHDVVLDNGLVAVTAPGATLSALAGQVPDALAFTALCAQVSALRDAS